MDFLASLHKWKISQCVIVAQDHGLQGVFYSPAVPIGDMGPWGGVVDTGTALWAGVSWGTLQSWY